MNRPDREAQREHAGRRRARPAPAGGLCAGFDAAPFGDWSGYLLPGHAARNRPADGVLNTLWVRAAAFRGHDRTVVLILAEVLAIDRELECEIVAAVTRVLEAAGAPIPHSTSASGKGPPRAAPPPGDPLLPPPTSGLDVLVCATHTHTGPPVFSLGEAEAVGPARAELTDLAARAAERALQNARPVTRIGFRIAHNSYAVNRRLQTEHGVQMAPNPGGPVDPSVALVSFYREPDHNGAPADAARAEDRPIGQIAVLPMHPTALSPQIAQLSGDVAGVFGAALEEAGDVPCLVLQGASGNVRPNLVDAEGAFRGGEVRELIAMGRDLANRLIEAEERGVARGGDIRFTFTSSWVELALAPVEDKHSPPPPPAAESLLGRRVSMLAFDEALALVLLPGEPFVELAWAIRNSVRDTTDCEVLVAGHAGATVGYVATAEAADLGGYEPAEAYRYYGFSRPLARECGEELVTAAARLLRDTVVS